VLESIEALASTESTAGGLVRKIAARFESAGFDSPRLDARVLVASVLNIEPSQLFAKFDDDVGTHAWAEIEKLVVRRLAREPVSRIVGVREFWGLDFALTPETLDPRPDTETLVSATLELRALFGLAPVRVLDLGTGTGCILLAILSEWPQATGVGIDISEGAVAAATANAVCLGLAQRAAFRLGNWSDGLEDSFDIVVSNPPYIAEGERSSLSAEVAEYDPATALFGGADGLAAYRQLLPAARRVIAPQGHFIVEIGLRQTELVTNLLAPAGFKIEAQKEDLAKVIRCLVARPA
jgi:release factor glutamine methyltransferase